MTNYPTEKVFRAFVLVLVGFPADCGCLPASPSSLLLYKLDMYCGRRRCRRSRHWRLPLRPGQSPKGPSYAKVQLAWESSNAPPPGLSFACVVVTHLDPLQVLATWWLKLGKSIPLSQPKINKEYSNRRRQRKRRRIWGISILSPNNRASDVMSGNEGTFSLGQAS